MPIEDAYRQNFDTLLRAAHDGRLALLDCQDKATGQPVRVVVAIGDDDDGVVFVPLAQLFDGDPYARLNPPNPDGGYYVVQTPSGGLR